MENKESWKIRTIALGTVIGAIAGGLAALILVQRAEQNHTAPKLTPGEGVKLGMGVFGLLKILSDSLDR
jgi:hypothetical protein